MTTFTTTTPSKKYQYSAIVDNDNDGVKDDETVATAVTVIVDDDDIDNELYYPVKLSTTTTKGSVLMKRRVKKPKAARSSCCCICGCITLSIFICLVLLLILIGIISYMYIVKGVRMVTVETPIDFPVITVTNQELDMFSDQVDTFMKFILDDDENYDDDKGTTTKSTTNDLIIPSRILNGAISQCDYLRGHAQIIFNENEFIFQTSLPMDIFPGGKHRYFVSTIDTTTTTTTTMTMTTSGSKEQQQLLLQQGTITTTSFDLGKKLSGTTYDGPLLITQFLSYLDNTTQKKSIDHNNTADPTTTTEWVINVLKFNFMGQEMISSELLTHDDDPIDILQQMKDELYEQQHNNDPNNTKYLFQFINGIDSIRIVPDHILIRARSKYNNNNNINNNSSMMMMDDDAELVDTTNNNNNDKGDDEIVVEEKVVNVVNNNYHIDDDDDQREEDESEKTVKEQDGTKKRFLLRHTVNK